MRPIWIITHKNPKTKEYRVCGAFLNLDKANDMMMFLRAYSSDHYKLEMDYV